MSLLPPNATAAERALEEAMLSGIDLSTIGTLWDPWTCPPAVLPFLAWAVAISHWDSDWMVDRKREAVAGAMAFHKIKGTREAVEEVLDRFHPLLKVVEWWERTPPGRRHTFEVQATLGEIPADFLTVETAEAIIRDVAAAKPLRAHFDFVQKLNAQATLYLTAGGLAGTMFRADYTATHDTSRDWSAVFQLETGEPVLTEDGTDYLETN